MSRVDPTQRNPFTSASREGVEVLSPNDKRGNNARNITADYKDDRRTDESADPNYDRRTGQNFSRTTNANANPTNNQTQTNSNQDLNDPPSGKNAFENMIGKGRTAVDKFGTTLMWGAGGFAGLLYLGLGWKKLAMVIGGLGVGVGYLLKTKLAKVGEEPDHNQRIVNEVKAMKLPKELEKEIFEFLNQRLTADAYKNSNGQDLSAKAKDVLGNLGKQAANAAQQAASTVADRFNKQPSTQPA